MGLPETASKFKCYNPYLEKSNDKKVEKTLEYFRKKGFKYYAQYQKSHKRAECNLLPNRDRPLSCSSSNFSC